MQYLMTTENLRLDSLFPDDVHHSRSRIEFSDLPYLSRPAVEYIHDTRPDIVIAGDRGARMFGRCVLQSWHRRFPGESFPTTYGGVQFARVTRRGADNISVQEAVRFAFEHSGPKGQKTEINKDCKVMYLDDWTTGGGTVARFVKATESLGISPDNISYATLCGKSIGIRHVVGDTSRNPLRSIWDDEGGSSVYVGMKYTKGQPTVPLAEMNPRAALARRELTSGIDEYYAKFTAALAAGSVVACGCVVGVGVV